MVSVRRIIQVSALAGACALAAGVSAGAQAPPAVSSASLTQQGQDLVWSIRFARPFYPASLGRAHRSLCLLLERSSRTTVCVAPGRHHKPPPRLMVGGHVIAASVSHSRYSLKFSFMPAAAGLGYKRLRWQVESAAASPPCTQSCTSFSPGRPKVLKLHIPRPVGCVPRGPDEVSQGPSSVHDIALTFDDGPWPDPPTIAFVNELARLHVPGTFFEIGDQISTYDRNGSAERAMLAHGDMIGDHTWTHPDMLSLSPAAQRSELTMTAAAIKRATGFQVCLFRPPYGDVNSALTGLARSMGMTTIMWDIDPRDWALPGTGEIESNVIGNARNGGITEMHFGGGPRYETLDALPTIVSALRRRGYRFVTLTQMLGYKLIYK